MTPRRTKTQPKRITITAERLSDNSRITFTLASNTTIEQLRSLLNRHLPPYKPNNFRLYSCQRGALIHFHPASFTLDYFPVIFDQSVLLLKMDDRITDNNQTDKEQKLKTKITEKKQSRKFRSFLLSKTDTTNTSISGTKRFPLSSSTSTNSSCFSLLKQLLFRRHLPNDINDPETKMISY